MSRKLIIGGTTAFYSYNKAHHRIDAHTLVHGHVRRVSAYSLGAVKSMLYVLVHAAGHEIFTLMPERAE